MKIKYKKYKIVAELNRNYYNSRYTYQAVDLNNQLVVLKIFKFNSAAEWKPYRDLERESKILQKLNHVGIPKIVEIIDARNEICIVTQYVDALNLGQQLQNLSPADVKNIVLSVLEIFEYLQKQGIVHRDIKPENILWDGKQVYLVDFGLSLVNQNMTLSASSAVAGTWGFIAPEQLKAKKIDYRADLYALGVTIACLLTQTPTSEVDRLFDNYKGYLKVSEFRLNHKDKYWIKWIKQLTKPQREERPSISKAIDTIRYHHLILPEFKKKCLSCIKNTSIIAIGISLIGAVIYAGVKGIGSVQLPNPKLDFAKQPVPKHRWLYSPEKQAAVLECTKLLNQSLETDDVPKIIEVQYFQGVECLSGKLYSFEITENLKAAFDKFEKGKQTLVLARGGRYNDYWAVDGKTMKQAIRIIKKEVYNLEQNDNRAYFNKELIISILCCLMLGIPLTCGIVSMIREG